LKQVVEEPAKSQPVEEEECVIEEANNDNHETKTKSEVVPDMKRSHEQVKIV
jgi:hypothetical protein